MGRGLADIKNQLLPRSGLSFRDLLSLLKTRFVGRRLVILSVDRTLKFDESMANMRLWQLPLGKDAEESVIDPGLCDHMHGFVRLKNKLQWPIEQLDAVLATLSGSGTLCHDAQVLDQLVAVKQLATMTARTPSELQPLWGEMDTYRETSLYAKLFLKADEGEDDVVLVSNIITGTAKISDHLGRVLLALQISASEYESIKSAAQIPDQLSIANLSQLYRISLLCRILEVSPLDYERFLSLSEHRFDPFTDPATTLSVVERFSPRQTPPLPWALAELSFIVRGVPNGLHDSPNTTLQKNIEVTTAIRAKLSTPRAAGDPTTDGNLISQVTKLCTRLLGAERGRQIVDFLEDPSTPANPTVGEDQFIAYLEPFLANGGTQGLFKALIAQKVAPTSYDPDTETGEEKKEEKKETEQKAKEDAAITRRKIFIDAITPVMARTEKRQLILNILRSSVPKLQPTTMRFLLDGVIRQREEGLEGVTIRSGIEVLLRLGESLPIEVTEFDGYFRPPTTDIYTFINCAAGEEQVTLRLDRAELNFEKTTAKRPRATSSRLVRGQWYSIRYCGNIYQLQWSPQSAIGVAPSSFTQDNLVDARIVASTGAVMAKLMQLSLLVNRLGLEDTEIEFWQTTGQFDFNNVSAKHVHQLEQYRNTRDGFVRASAKRPLIELYRWLLSPMQDKAESLPEWLASVTSWPKRVCSSFLDAKYPKLDESACKERFKDISAIAKMQETMRFVTKVNLPSMSMKAFFAAAEPAVPTTVGSIVTKDFDDAAALRSAMQSRMSPSSMRMGPTQLSAANDQIRDGQRNALLHCLLSEKHKVNEYATSAEKLFGYFLCDVEMGPELQTSRIKQSISTVQLFVQRCLLGAESVYGVDNVARNELMTRDLDSMLRNWLDPTLRDDKTDEFLALESAIMEKKLDMDTITALVKGYMYRVNEVADLQVDAYLWERKDKRTVVTATDAADPGKQDIKYESTFHLFGRTRTTPATYYYRTLRLGGTSGDIIVYWSPWRKMNVDIPVQDLDGAGNKLPKAGSYLVPAVFNGRLVPPPDIQHRWEMRLGFIEYQNGKWSTKKVSQSAIYVSEEDKKLPSVSEFQFQVDAREEEDSIVRVQVGRVVGHSMKTLGYFEMRGQQLVLIDKENYPVPSIDAPSFAAEERLYKLEFSKLISRGEDSWAVLPGDGVFSNSDPQPLLPVKRRRKDKTMSHNLVMSFDHINYRAPTGFVFESSDVDKAQTFFAFPPDYDSFIRKSKRDDDDDKEDDIESAKKKVVKLKGEKLKTENLSDYINPMLLKRMNAEPGLHSLYNALSTFQYSADAKPSPGDFSHDVFSRRNSVLPHELSTPFAIYNWELGVHIPSLLIEHLMATRQYELALTVARLVFDPTVVGSKIEEAWSFPPFRDIQVRTGKGFDFDLDWKRKMTQNEWLESKWNVHAAARGNPAAYLLRIAIKYIKILIAAGDEHFRQNSLESIPLALQRYTEASQVFGPQPATIPRLGKPAVRTYNQIKGHIDSNTNLKVDIGLEFPFFGLPSDDESKKSPTERYMGFVRTDYFCVPANPALVALRNRIDDRLYNIRHGLDMNGRKRTLALFEPPIDPGALVRAAAGLGGASLGGLLADLESPMPKYRFSYLIQRAYDLVNELKGSAQQLISIKEKKDAEGLSMLRYKHQQCVLALTLRIKEHQKKEVQRVREVLEESRKQLEMQLGYYLQLTGEAKTVPRQGEIWEDIAIAIEARTKDDLRMSPYENMEGICYDTASSLNTNAAHLDAEAAALLSLPTVTTSIEPWGIGLSTSIGGSTFGQVVQGQASHLRARAQAAADEGGRAARKSALSRQLQERLLQVNTIGHELMRVDKDIAHLDTRVASVEWEIKAQQQEAENAAAEEEWMRKKYTNQQLYAFLDHSTSEIFHQTYLLALDMAKAARRALDFEHAVRYPDSSASSQPSTSIGGYWENSIDGLTSGDALLLDLRKMEMMHLENDTHDFEITKAISLRQIDPLALVQFQESGSAKITLDETLFDRDFPGHYCRRISSVALSIPCIVGPYSSINCTLTLTKHKYRISPIVKDAATLYAEDESKYRTDQIPITTVAISTGVQDTGRFDLDFHGSGQYSPFEGAGAISEWQIHLPEKRKQFDYRTISDVVMHLRYTAVDSSGRLEETVEKKIDSVKAPALAINLKDDYPAEWHKVASKQQSATKMVLAGLRNRLPFWIREKTVIRPSSLKVLVHPGCQSATLMGQTPQTAVPLAESSGDAVGKHTALGPSTTTPLPPLSDEPWKLDFGSATLQRGWLLIEY
ncbi:hypothetical protein IFM46972_11349 [Aspergillus udagawae]|uniref:Uncharacterized protein n=1 Tax=Aspergillus udagawae TaxID=91492 RepID=A0A8H3SG85_9EURO|nr:hypothetical protein IFM46972_11349 [Aspergillus udagawae]